ncbi:hypothetical protein ACF1FC_05365 [Streptomyces sp. NPDC014344]|uniref:hypothetical protein n=1 Tax=Streptomyces sp. NPDC014344 TaxID=3364871 RepID=UPI0036F6F314
MTETPWYMRKPDPSAIDTGDPERKRKHLASIASAASPEADAVAAHLKAAEAQGVPISPTSRLAMGYAQTARLAAAQLDALPQHSETASAGDADLTPEQRMAYGYGSGPVN